jgi:predicted permease
MSLLRRFSNLFTRRKLDHEIDAELTSHIEMRMEDNIAAGMSKEAAHRDAMLRFGNPALMKERVTGADAALMFDGIARDTRYAIRHSLRSPAFALTAIVTLALGIGANVVVFGVLNSLILHPLNVAGADRLFSVVQKQHGNDSQSYPDYLDFRTRNNTFSDIVAYKLYDAALSIHGVPKKSWFYEVSGNYFRMLGLRPQLGRFFDLNDEHGPNSAPYVVLSDSFWRDQFGGDPRVLGTTVDINKHPFTVIGVAPRDFHGTEVFFWPDFWVPMINEQQINGYEYLSQRKNHGLWVIGKVRDGVTVSQATDNLNAIGAQLAKEYPDEDDGLGARLIKPGLMGDFLGDPARAFMTGILLLALLVLVAACANLAGIFAARVADRSRELAVRLAIGSSRWHVLRQVAMEAMVISLTGGVLGTLFATALLSVFSRWQPFDQFPIHVTVVPDWRVYGVALLLSLASSILPGLLPARQIWQTDAIQAMKSGGVGAVFRRATLRDILLATQIALCALLLTAALVALRGMQRSLHAPLGFQPEGVVSAETDLHMAGYSDQSSLVVQKRMLEQASHIPGLTAVGSINDLPLNTGGSGSPVYREGTTDFRGSNSVLLAKYYSISPGYLRAAETRLLRGRDFSWHDDAATTKVALVNATFARVMFGDELPIGHRFMIGEKSLYEIVGIVEDGKYDSLTESPQPAMFFPLAQYADSDTTVIVRSALPPVEVARALRRTLTSIDSDLPFTVRSWPDELAVMYFPARVATISLGVMGMLAAMLAVTGIFGMAAYSISKRWKEFGIRVSLGAQRAQLMRSALGRPLAILLTGSAAGLLMGVLASRLLAQIVYQATPHDPLVLCGVLLTMALLGLLATWIPARRVLAVNPAQLLRDE